MLKMLTINKIAIVIENWDLSERLLLTIFWGMILLFHQADRDQFIRDVFLLQNSCNAQSAGRSRHLLDSRWCVELCGLMVNLKTTYTIEFDHSHVVQIVVGIGSWKTM